MTALSLEDVMNHFGSDEDEVEPFVVCDGVSIATYNKYIKDTGESPPIRFQLLAYDAGRILIVDLPTSKIHESINREFSAKFLAATGDPHEIAEGGSMTAYRARHPSKSADSVFGPLRTTLNRTPPPRPRSIRDWITLAVEVGRYQTWASLENAAQWWCNYSGIQYILLLKISQAGTQMQYALYDITALGILPVPSASGTFRRNSTGQPPAQVTFDMHRVLSIPANQALPRGVNPTATVDLRLVMELALRSI